MYTSEKSKYDLSRRISESQISFIVSPCYIYIVPIKSITVIRKKNWTKKEVRHMYNVTTTFYRTTRKSIGKKKNRFRCREHGVRQHFIVSSRANGWIRNDRRRIDARNRCRSAGRPTVTVALYTQTDWAREITLICTHLSIAILSHRLQTLLSFVNRYVGQRNFCRFPQR